MNYEGEKFLLKLYRELYKEDVVKHSGSIKDDKYELLRKYMKRLENLEKAFDGNHEEALNTLKKMYYNKYVIKEEDIPESYYENQKRIALEQGYGYIEYTDDMKKQEANMIIEEQEKSLDVWLNYLMKENASYPMWARYWAFQGMLKLGVYDKEKKEFTRRSKGTTKPFPELNAEALALSIDLVTNNLYNKNIEDKELQELINNGSFGKIYAYNIRKLINEERKNSDNSTSLDGVWIKYHDGDTEKLVKSLEGKGTGWCIAGEGVARDYLSIGDLHIYYTKDSNGEYTKPRVCIREAYGKIAEVRGIEQDQNLEAEMIDITDKKLDEFSDKEEYKQKVSDMRMLTKIYNKNKSGEELTKEELRFLYELDSNIKGFGWKKDPRIEEIRKNNLIYDKDFALEIVEKDGLNLAYTNKELQNDKEIVLEAARRNMNALKYASDKLQNDKEIYLKAFKTNLHCHNIDLINSPYFDRNDKDLVLIAVKENGRLISYASEELQNDREVVLEAVKSRQDALMLVSDEFKNDKEIVLAAIHSKSKRSLRNALFYASEELQNDREVVLEAIKQSSKAFNYASEELKHDKDIILAAIEQSEKENSKKTPPETGYNK